MNLKSKILAIPDIISSIFYTAKDGWADESVVAFRKAQCSSCPLFIDGKCSHDYFTDGKNLYTIHNVVEALEEKNGVIVQGIAQDNVKVTRGCGCSLTGDTGKWRLQFEKRALQRDDGKGACPRGKWSFKNFVQHKLGYEN